MVEMETKKKNIMVDNTWRSFFLIRVKEPTKGNEINIKWILLVFLILGVVRREMNIFLRIPNPKNSDLCRP
jgi:hypothetical protein